LGGGYYASDLSNPNLVTSVTVDNSPGNNPGRSEDDLEVALDIQVIQGVAPGTRIVVYFAPNTPSGFVDAITDAFEGTANCNGNKLVAISISWAGAESGGTPTSYLQSMNNAIQSASLLGIVVTAATGDSGSQGGIAFPASSPYALACGGTSITVSSGVITKEIVWNDNTGASGGGVSTFFAMPSWQVGIVPSSVSTTYRALPDVAANADPNTGYNIKYQGSYMAIGGTSAAAPLWAGLTSLMSQSRGQPVGDLQQPTPNFNQLLYTVYRTVPLIVHDITQGNDGAYSAGVGWDECTGLGSPNGALLLASL